MGPLSRPGEGPPTFSWPNTPPIRGWYGIRLAFTGPLEAETRCRLGRRLRVDIGVGWLRYTVHGVRYDGDPHSHTVTITFEANPWLPTYGLPADEFPRVYADPGQLSPHRHLDDALCLWKPTDPASMRWTPDKGLHDLFGLAARHLFAEYWWREHDEWLLPEAPHGFDEGGLSKRRPPPSGPTRRRRRAA